MNGKERLSAHRNEGEQHENAAKDELVGPLGVCLVDVVHIARACNDLRTMILQQTGSIFIRSHQELGRPH